MARAPETWYAVRPIAAIANESGSESGTRGRPALPREAGRARHFPTSLVEMVKK